MTIEASLRIELNGKTQVFSVKMIRIESTGYFFIRAKEPQDPLLGDKVLELTYTGSFTLTEFAGIVRSPDISRELITAIQNELLKNKEFWF